MKAASRNLTHLAAALIGLLLLVSAALAQTTPDYEAWESTATRAQDAIDSARASDSAFEQLRAEIVAWRNTFDDAQATNASRIATLSAQMEALGPKPAEGEDEPADIAERRTELEGRMAELRRPVLNAEEASGRATGLITEIDRIIRDRQRDALFQRESSPLDFRLWGGVRRDLDTVFDAFGRELETAWSSTRQRAVLRDNAPLAIGFALAAILLLFRARRWINWYGDRYLGEERKNNAIWFTALSFGRALLPILGVYALDEAIFATGMVGFRFSAVLEQVPFWAVAYFGYRWIASCVFAEDPRHRLVPLSDEDCAEARRLITFLSVVVILRGLIVALGSGQYNLGDSQIVLMFPVELVAAWALFRMGTLLRLDLQGEDLDGNSSGTFFNSVTSILGRILQIVAVIGPILAAAGYARAANALLFPAIETLVLLGLVMVLQDFLAHVYARLTQGDENATDGLVPVMIGIVMVLASLPLLALIWGARVADLADLWTAFNEGFKVGDTRISPTQFILAIVVFAIGYSVTRLIQGTMRSSVLPKTKIDPGGQNAIVAGLGYVGVFLAAIIAITTAGIDLSAFAIFASALAVGIGFGMQTIASNFVSGIILLVERPINEGDWIEVGGQMGYVRDISVRSTRIETFDRTEVIVPNADLVSGVVTNWTRGNTIGRVIVPVGVAYGTDTRKVERILREIAEGHPMVVASPPPNIVFQGFGADSMDFEIRAILRDVNWVLSVKSDMNHEIAAKFAEEGIEIPFAQRDVWLRNPETLKGEET